ncbi:zinc ABC transporter substrate-binding protein [Catenulispora sp. NF23]|uniref:metal ABC transporter substrate-binding protein n=1 Tax=Catenulispora pinistramenti TaxID=2705254 RepID=UPI001BA854E9|nr:metal ABC transporter substrate-binding protein [Catenulispora pinistramenti]MBS2539356.1 zinc ABC transporter substrate-binding protein [Catenulispora pinistramenti]
MPFRTAESRRRFRPGVPARVAGLVAVLVAALTLSGCLKQSDQHTADGRLDVVAGFYPFAYLAEQIGGDHVAVRNLTKPGAEPHDLELTPSQVGAVSKADLAIYEKGLQPAVDAAVAQNKPKAALDTATVVHLEDHGDLGEGDAHSADPHVWLDPVDFAKIADAVSAELQRIDPAHAADFQAKQSALDGELRTLDADYRAGLAHCQRQDIVTSHAAFGYLAERYGLVQVPIAGLSPDDEPSAAHLAKIQDLIKTKGVTTVFFETLASPKTARTLAADTGTKAAVLDPIEGVKDPSKQDYLSIMRDNLAALRSALGCS